MGEVVLHEEVDPQHLDYSALVLSAICRTDSFSFLVSDAGQQHLASTQILFERRHHHFDKPLGYLAEVMAREQLLYEDFNRSSFALRGIPYHCCSISTLKHTEARHLLREFTYIAPSDLVCVDAVPGTDLRILYAYPERFRDELSLYFESGSICHVMTALIWSALKRSRKGKPGVYVVASDGWVEIIVVQDHNLVFSNQFPWSSRDDILYYTTAILRAVDLSDASFAIHVLGRSYTEDLAEYLHKHLTDVPFTEASTVELRLFDLLSIARCGL